MEDTITLMEAALQARLSYGRALRLLLTGAWEGERLGRRWLVRASSVRRWQESQLDAEGAADVEV
jgi:hypothetical protein